ncbi:FliH/SctL family protein [Paenibacillus mesotrionivorans]|uniref:FliH/SctL family protein n=1 Tax=Paenibacillus mesotrionivorans TaxID=3160968 RepID=A0ACC7NSY1_9BACL
MSRVIKPQYYITLDDRKEINVSPFPLPHHMQHETQAQPVTDEEEAELRQLLQMKDRILLDAENVAEEQIRQALEDAEELRASAQQEIEGWWEERRGQDRQAMEEARQGGFAQGFQEGQEQAEVKVLEQYDQLLGDARTVLEQAYELKRQIIQESEPFLVELATAIAGKIIQQELSVNPQWVIEMTKGVLARKREKGTITLCVSPKQFAYIRDARDELKLSVDSQAELEILPDSTIDDYGCVVRTAFGSIDARVDTQLKEIKLALQQLSMEMAEGEEEA